MQGSANILLADDDENFVLLFRAAFEYTGAPVDIAAVSEGVEVIRYLKGEGRFEDRQIHPTPDVILLDLRLPRMNGLEVLRWVHQNRRYSEIPVIMLTGVDIEQESENARQAGAAAFFIKPFQFERLVELAEHIAEAWLHAPVAH